MKLYGLKTCDTCRKALKSLPSAQFVDVRVDGVPEAVLTRALGQFGNGLVNTRSTTWRSLSPEARTAEPLALLKENPTLMKRPLIDTGESLHLGWGAETQTALLG